MRPAKLCSQVGRDGQSWLCDPEIGLGKLRGLLITLRASKFMCVSRKQRILNFRNFRQDLPTAMFTWQKGYQIIDFASNLNDPIWRTTILHPSCALENPYRIHAGIDFLNHECKLFYLRTNIKAQAGTIGIDANSFELYNNYAHYFNITLI